MKPVLAIAFVACAIAQTDDRKVTSYAGGGVDSDTHNARNGTAREATASGDEHLTVVRDGDLKKQIARTSLNPFAMADAGSMTSEPRKLTAGSPICSAGAIPARQHPFHTYAPPIALSVMAAADYHTTQRAFRNVPTGREANPILSCGGELCGGRFVALNAAMAGAMLAVNRYALQRLSPRGRRALSILEWGAIGFRGYVVVHNYRAGGVR